MCIHFLDSNSNLNQLILCVQGFFCKTEADFEELCHCIRKYILHGQKTPMFELHKHRPAHWPDFEPYTPEGATGGGLYILARFHADLVDGELEHI